MYWSVFLTRSTLCREWLCLVCCAPLCLFNSFHIVLCIALSRVVYYSVSLTRSTLCCAVHRCVLCTVVSFRPVPHRFVLCIALCCVLSCLIDPFNTVLCCALLCVVYCRVSLTRSTPCCVVQCLRGLKLCPAQAESGRRHFMYSTASTRSDYSANYSRSPHLITTDTYEMSSLK